MNLSRIDLNLLVFLDVLLRERNVTKAADQLGITQPAMSNGLKRLRDLFDDPLLIRTSKGMTPTERAEELQPYVREILASIEKTVQPASDFNVAESDRLFRIMASDYAESTLLPALLDRLRIDAPNVRLDFLTPSDVSFQDVEKGKIDMAINRFDYLPQSFHQAAVWRDNFACLMHKDNPAAKDFSLDSYLSSPHIWVSKTGMGVGVGMNPNDTQRLGRVDEALAEMDKTRNIKLFTRHYQVATQLAHQPDLIATLPRQLAKLSGEDPNLVMFNPPFPIVPIELKMAWSPLVHHNAGHTWLRKLIREIAQEIINY